MSPRNRVENALLRALLKEAKWTNHNLSLAVNRVAAEAGTVLHYDRTTVSHWLWGTKPRPPVAEFVAEALSRRLRRFVTTADIGMAGTATEGASSARVVQSGVTALHDLVMADLDPVRRAQLYQEPFRIDWAVAGQWRPTGSEQPDRRDQPRPVAGHTAALVGMTSAFTAVDQAFGGGAGRSALKTHLAADVLTWLRSSSGEEERRELLTVAAALTRLMGFKCFDNLHHNIAQRYYRVSLKLAEEAGDALGYAGVLFYMSIQAWFLGHYGQAAQLGSAAIDRVNGLVPPEAFAAFLGQAAVSCAALTRHKEAAAFLSQAERHVGNAGAVSPSHASHQADLAHRAGQAMFVSRKYRRAEIWFGESLRLRPSGERRSRMLTSHLLADAQLRQGRIERACETWEDFLDEYPYMRSGRIDSAFRVLCQRLYRYRGHVAAERTLHEARKRAGYRS